MLNKQNITVFITPFQGSVFDARSFRRALPHAIDYRAFSPVAGITDAGTIGAGITGRLRLAKTTTRKRIE
jgi:hypothetical protein